MTDRLDELARRYGIALAYEDVSSQCVRASDDAKRAVLQALGIPARSRAELGESLKLAPPQPDTSLRAPPKTHCFMPAWLERGRCWGIALQLYQLRSLRNWGIGDFADLAAVAKEAGARGADFLGTNPLHALFLAAPDHASPFSPSNRRFLNPLYIAVDHVPGFDPDDVPEPTLKVVRESELVDYATVARLKTRALRHIWGRWRDGTVQAKAPYTAGTFRAFYQNGGEALERHCLFEAVSSTMVAEGYSAGWLSWAAEFQHPDDPVVRAFAAAHRDEVEFHGWLQWLADVQLARASATARDAGMRIGLYLDLAVGEAPDGSATWSDRSLSVPALRIGAPPDDFSESGQDWGLAPLSPAELRARKFGPYREIMGQVLRHAGALRIDHAMGLYQMYVIPEGFAARDGLYLRYPLSMALRTLAGVSRDCEAVVIGEDLGTVPRGFRRVMRTCEIQSYRLLYFEHEGRRLRAPPRYPRRALTGLSTHDMPTLEAWWSGRDIILRQQLGQIEAETAHRLRTARAIEREGLLGALRRAGLAGESTSHPAHKNLDDALAAAIHAYLADAPSRLMVVRLEDLAGAREPVNVPGTSHEYPNWRRRLPLEIEALFSTDRYKAITQSVSAARPRGS